MATPRKPPQMKVVDERAEEDPQVSDLVSRLEAEAEADDEIATGSITLRWGKGQIAVVKRAAAILGVPYQTYLKQVVFRQAVDDIEHAEAVLGPKRRPGGTRRRSRSD